MSTKMKGLLKGLRYISQIFDEEKEQEMQIGVPTDVKHVAHIGWDGPAAVDNPSWMKEFNSTSTGFSAPLGPPGETKDSSEIKWVSEDSKRGQKTKNSPGKDLPEVPKSSRRQSSTDNNSGESPGKKDPAAKPRPSRKKLEAKDSSDGSSQQPQETNGAAPDVPRRSRRKKSKELAVIEGGSRRSKNRATTSSNATDASTAADHAAADADPQSLKPSPNLTTVATVGDEEPERRVVTFKE